jgi:ribosomal protein S18 acetylase RimI-like enzyme
VAVTPHWLKRLCEIVNRAYALAEAGIWHGQYARTSPAEMAAAIRGEQVVVAHLDDHLVGSICTRTLGGVTGWFGVVAVDPPYGGRGVGRELVAFAETRAAAAGSTTMQLELLVPNDHSITHTQLLTAWYERIGYREVGRRALADVEPDALPFLAMACDIAVYHKALGSDST